MKECAPVFIEKGGAIIRCMHAVECDCRLGMTLVCDLVRSPREDRQSTRDGFLSTELDRVEGVEGISRYVRRIILVGSVGDE